MDIGTILNQLIMMMIVLCVGVIGAKTGVIDPETNRRFSRFATTIPQSAIILASAMNMENGLTVSRVLLLLGAGAVMYALLLAVSLGVPRLLGVKKDLGLYGFAGAFGNVAFMGYPILWALYGSDAVFYAALLGMPFNILAYTIGIRMVSGRKEELNWRDVLNPALVSSIAAIGIIFLPVSWPQPVTEAANYLGDMIVPLSMLIIGASLGELRLRDVFGSWRAYASAPIKLLIAPVVVWAVMRLVLSDRLLLGIMTVEAAMPSATVGVMFSIRYESNERLMSQMVFVSTILSVVTIPFISWLLL